MAYNNADFAVTLPNSNGSLEILQARAMRTRQDREAKEKSNLARQDMLTKYVGGEFQDKDFATGTAMDPMINQKLAETREKYAEMIRKNPEMSTADLQFQMQKDLGNINSMSSNIKTVRAQIQARSKELAKEKGVDAAAWEQLAISKFLYKTDEKGNRVLREASELDPQKDYMTEVFQENPDLIGQGDEGFREHVYSFKPSKQSAEGVTEQGGVSVTKGYTAEIPAYMERVSDGKGNVTGLKVRSEVVDGIEIADEDVYKSFASKPGSALYIQSKFKEFNANLKKNGKQAIPDNSEEADLVKRMILLQELNDKGVSEYSSKNKVSKAASVDKREQGWSPASVATATAKEVAKAMKANEAVETTQYGSIIRGAGLDPTVMEGAVPESVGGKTMYNIIGTVGPLKLGYDKDHSPIYAQGLFADPANPGAMTVTDEKGNPQTYQKKEFRRFIKTVSGINGWNIDKAEKALNNHMDAEGNYKGVNKEASIELRSKARVEETRQTESKAIRQEAVAAFFTSDGDAQALTPFVGKKAKIAGKDVTIKRIDYAKKPWYSSDEAVVIVEDADGTEREMKFSKPKTGGDFKKFIENFTK